MVILFPWFEMSVEGVCHQLVFSTLMLLGTWAHLKVRALLVVLVVLLVLLVVVVVLLLLLLLLPLLLTLCLPSRP